jgi:hypothetical protein
LSFTPSFRRKSLQPNGLRGDTRRAPGGECSPRARSLSTSTYGVPPVGAFPCLLGIGPCPSPPIVVDPRPRIAHSPAEPHDQRARGRGSSSAGLSGSYRGREPEPYHAPCGRVSTPQEARTRPVSSHEEAIRRAVVRGSAASACPRADCLPRRAAPVRLTRRASTHGGPQRVATPQPGSGGAHRGALSVALNNESGG